MPAVEEASGDFERPLLLARLLLGPPLLLLSVAHETPLSAACASSSMLPAFTAVDEASGGLKRRLLLLRLPLLLLSAAHATPLSAACASLLLAAHDTPLFAACASLLVLAVEESGGDF